MKVNKIKAYAFELILLTTLTLCVFFSFKYIGIVIALITLISAIAISILLKQKQIALTNTKQVTKTLMAFAFFYLALFYTLGIYTGFYRNPYKLNLHNLFVYIIPIIFIIISTEKIRTKILSQNNKIANVVLIIITVLIDINLNSFIYDISRLNDFINVVGYVIFASIANNIFFNYVSSKYGSKPVIIYRLLTTLYLYILPVIPDVYIFFKTFFRMIYPFLLYSYIESFYNPDKEIIRKKDSRRENVLIVSSFVILALLICIVSCKFQFGALVIGSGSMTGHINKGDVVVFKKEKKPYEEGDVIVFQKGNIKVVHRIIKVDYKEDEYRYYTKGDANQLADDGYVPEDKVLGQVKFRIIKIGKPTLWLRDQFS